MTRSSSSTSRPPSGRRSGRATSALRRLADLAGIIPEYLDQTGKERRRTTDATRVAILAAMGIDASTDERAAAALERWRREAREEIVAPVRVVERDDPTVDRVALRSLRGAYRWRAELVLEDGARHTVEGRHAAAGAGDVRLPVRPPLGYHTLIVTIARARGAPTVVEQSLIVVPSRCTPPAALLGPRPAFGLIANLYTLRSAENWGVGDFSDLATLARWAGSVGGAVVGVNPLHALLNRGGAVSPYSPVSRLFRNVLYIDVARVPELAAAPHVADRLDNPAFQEELAELREEARVRYDDVAYLKRQALAELHRVFVERGDVERRRAYDEWARARDPELTRFAIWMAIGESRAAELPHRRTDAARDADPSAAPDPFDWRCWPEALRDPSSDAVRRFAEERAEAVDFHRWLQFEADRQLGEAARAAQESELAIGLYQDLAIGTSATSSDAWSFPDLFVTGASVGAPPDPYAAAGQNWGLPPMDPRALRRDRYRYFIALVRGAFRHAGALRIDHVMGLFRLFWIPAGLTGREGAYVRYPDHDLLGILALESARNRAIVVGEDLGTVPDDVPPKLARWGVLSSKVMYFERGTNGAFRPSSEYASLSLATANTHDMATLAGFWRGADVELRHEVGLIEGDEALDRERENRVVDRRELVARLESEGVLPAGWGHRAASPEPDAATIAELRGAVHEFLCRSPAALVGLSLDDLTGETTAVNVPGVGPERYPSWTRRMTVTLEELPASADVRAALRCAGRGHER